MTTKVQCLTDQEIEKTLRLTVQELLKAQELILSERMIWLWKLKAVIVSYKMRAIMLIVLLMIVLEVK